MFRTKLKNFAKVFGQKAFGKYLVVTNTISMGVLLGAGDAAEQLLVERYRKKENVEFDAERAKRTCQVGFAITPILHYWYQFLDTRFPGFGKGAIVKKLVIDSLFGSPLQYGLYFTVSGLFEGQGLVNSIKEFAVKFPPVYLADLIVWTPMQFVNFYFFGPTMRIIVMASMNGVWVTFLSFMKHEYKNGNKVKEDDKEDKES